MVGALFVWRAAELAAEQHDAFALVALASLMSSVRYLATILTTPRTQSLLDNSDLLLQHLVASISFASELGSDPVDRA